MPRREQMRQSNPFADAGGVTEPSSSYRISVPTSLGICHLQVRKTREEELFGAAAGNGITLPVGPKMLRAGSIMFMATGPDAWLALEPDARFSLHHRLQTLLGPSVTVTDQSDGYCVLALGGPKVRTILAKGVALDLDQDVFLPGDAAVTSVAHMTVTLWRLEDDESQPAFMLAVPRSYASSFLHWLHESTMEFRSIA